MQLGFSILWDGFANNREAIKARNAKAKSLRAEGKVVRCFVLPNQTKKYDGLGQPNGGVCENAIR